MSSPLRPKLPGLEWRCPPRTLPGFRSLVQLACFVLEISASSLKRPIYALRCCRGCGRQREGNIVGD
jgi:hypothetical protein